jgi:hypothetical protein
MSTSDNRDKVRKALLETDGLTVAELYEIVGTTPDNIRKMLRKMYGCYISGWKPVGLNGGAMAAIWSCVRVPADMPDPTGRTESIRDSFKDPNKMVKTKQYHASRRKKEMPTSNKTRWAFLPPWFKKETNA